MDFNFFGKRSAERTFACVTMKHFGRVSEFNREAN